MKTVANRVNTSFDSIVENHARRTAKRHEFVFQEFEKLRASTFLISCLYLAALALATVLAIIYPYSVAPGVSLAKAVWILLAISLVFLAAGIFYRNILTALRYRILTGKFITFFTDSKITALSYAILQSIIPAILLPFYYIIVRYWVLAP